jgi:energy-coupling factor transporter ATP-binding protein EcfA2
VAQWYLEGIELSGGFLSDVRLTLPRGLICIIGPRGSGKSTLAEALRMGLGGLPAGASKERLAFLKNNLGSALITLKTGAGPDRPAYTVRRTYTQAPVLTTADGKPVTGIDLDRGSFLPLDAYSSLEIEAIADESLGGKRRALLDDLCAADMQRVQLALADQRRTLEANADAIKAARRRVADITERIEELGDVHARHASLPPAAGQAATPEFQAATTQREANEREREALRTALDAITQLRIALPAAVDVAKRRFPGVISPPESQNRAMLEGVTGAAEAMWAGVGAGISTADRAAADAESLLRDLEPKLEAAHAAQEAAYLELQQQNQEAAKAAEAQSVALREVAALERFRKELAEANEDLHRLQEARGGIKADFLLTRDQISGLREGVASRLQQESGKKVRIRVHRNADGLEYQQQLLDGLSGSKTKNQEESAQTLSRIPPEHLAQIIRDKDYDELETLTAFGRERGRKILDALAEKLEPLALEVLPIDDRVAIELNVASGSVENFKDASELSRGQKCTALLPILLARRDSPLVIDQPEDNLDNHFIYETVVDSIRRLKPRRQMIFITHNANIPVLGEAELVVVMNSDGRRAFVEKVGSVDECRREVIDLLEGGEEAFQLRRRRYGS